MIGSLARFFRILFRERPLQLKPGVRYLATLDLAKVRPGMSTADVKNWLMQMGFTPTGKDEVWKANENYLSRLPHGSIVKATRL